MDKYVVVHKSPVDAARQSHCSSAYSAHPQRIAKEHLYARCQPTRDNLDTANPSRQLPHAMLPEQSVMDCHSSDGVLNYSSAVLNGGLLLLELRDGIREGDGEWALRVWKFMLLYWRNARYTQYSYEAICRLNAVATSTPQLAHEVQWCRFVKTKGGLGNNIPVDLCMEHLNRFLKDCLLGLGANVSEHTIVKTSKSL